MSKFRVVKIQKAASKERVRIPKPFSKRQVLCFPTGEVFTFSVNELDKPASPMMIEALKKNLDILIDEAKKRESKK